MDFWQPVVVTFVASLGALSAVWVSTRDLRLRRRMDTVDRFIKIAANSQARGREGDRIGSSEQVAAIYLLAELGSSEKELTIAADASLSETVRWSDPAQRESDAPDKGRVEAALRQAAPNATIDEASIAKVLGGVRREQEQRDSTLAEINKHAIRARQLLESSKHFQSLDKQEG